MAQQQLIEKLDEYNGESGYFLKIFFVNDKMNGNIWKVAKTSIPDGLRTGLRKVYNGKTAPLIERPDWDQAPKRGHPSPYSMDMRSEQEPDRIGDMVAVGMKDDNIRTGWVIVRLTDIQAQEDHRNGKIVYVSPSIKSIRESPQGEDLEWEINHLAVVDDPAYSWVAHVTGSCTGETGQCINHLAKQAAANKFKPNKGEEPDDDGYYWRTIRGRKIPFMLGENMQNKIDEATGNNKNPKSIKGEIYGETYEFEDGKMFYVDRDGKRHEAKIDYFDDDYHSEYATVKRDGHYIPITSEGEYEKLKAFIQRSKEKEDDKQPKRKNSAGLIHPTKIDPKTGFRLNHRQKITIRTIKKEIEGRIREAWNNTPDWKKNNVREINIFDAGVLSGYGGSYGIGKEDLRIFYQPFNKESWSNIAKTLEHELGHARFNHWPLAKIKEWVERTKYIGPVSKYAGTFHNSEKEEKNMANASRILNFSTEIIEITKKGGDYTQHGNQSLLRTIENSWDITKDDIINGRLEYLANQYYHSTYNIYANEQHSDFVSAYNGHKVDELNQENYDKLKVIYEELQQKYGDPINSKSAAILLPSRRDIILQASKFKPTKGEDPDSDGYYWRTIRGRKIPFKEGEEMQNKIDGAIKPEPQKQQEKMNIDGENFVFEDGFMYHVSVDGIKSRVKTSTIDGGLRQVEGLKSVRINPREYSDVVYHQLKSIPTKRDEINRKRSKEKTGPVKIDISTGLKIMPGQHIFDMYQGDEDFMDEIRTAWNNAPDWKRKNVKTLYLNEVTNGHYGWGAQGSKGQFEPGVNKITLDISEGPMTFLHLKGLVEHELAHSRFAHWNVEKLTEWVERTKDFESITNYSDVYASPKKRMKTMLAALDGKYAADEVIRIAKRGGDYSDRSKYGKGQVMLQKVTGVAYIPEKQLKDGSLQRKVDQYFQSVANLYQNEQFAEFMAAYSGKRVKGINIEAYKKFVKVYEDIELRDSKSKTKSASSLYAPPLGVLKRRCDIILRQAASLHSIFKPLRKRRDVILQAASSTKFKPNKGESPDSDGNYWRTIRGRKIPFKEGEDMSQKVDDTIKTRSEDSWINHSKFTPFEGEKPDSDGNYWREINSNGDKLPFKEGEDLTKKKELSDVTRNYFETIRSKELLTKDNERKEETKNRKHDIKSKLKKREQIKLKKSKIKVKPAFKDKDGFLVNKDQHVTINSTNKSYIDKVRESWNSIPLWKKENVRVLKIQDNTSKIGGAMGFDGTLTLKYNISSNVIQEAYVNGFLEHELAHSRFFHWPLAKIKEWIERTEDIGPVSTYSGSYMDHNSDTVREFRRQASKFATTIDGFIRSAKSGGTITNHNSYNAIKRRMDQWGLTKDDITNGKLQEMADKVYFSIINIYANEQHSEFLKAYNDNDIEGFDIENYEKLEAIYEDMQLKDYSQTNKSALLRSRSDIILQASKFKPTKGEDPDSDGYYWRTIRGRKIPFKEGENMQSKIDDATSETAKKTKSEKTVFGRDYVFEDGQMLEKLSDGTKRPSQVIKDKNHTLVLITEDGEKEHILNQNLYDDLIHEIKESIPRQRDLIESKRSKEKTGPSELDEETGFKLLKGQQVYAYSDNTESVDKIRKYWNSMSDWKKNNVKELTITDDLALGGFYQPFKDGVVIGTSGSDIHKNFEGGLVEHELAHSRFANWSLDKFREWRARTKDVESVSQYAKDYIDDPDTRELTVSRIKSMRETLRYVENDPTGYTETKHWPTTVAMMKEFGLSPDDMFNGRMKKVVDLYERSIINLYQNEQFAEFITAYNGHKVTNLNISAYKKLKEIYEDIELREDSNTKSASAKLLLPSRRDIILQAAKFKPNKGEEPDDDGYYWRTIRGRKLPFKSGEDMDKKMNEVTKDNEQTTKEKPVTHWIGSKEFSIENEKIFYQGIDGKKELMELSSYKNTDDPGYVAKLVFPNQDNNEIKLTRSDVQDLNHSLIFSMSSKRDQIKTIKTKNLKPTFIDKNTGFRINKDQKVIFNTKNTALIDKVRDTWNSIPNWRKKNIEEITIGDTDYFGGSFLMFRNQIKIAHNKSQMEEHLRKIPAILEHELGHSRFDNWSISKMKEFAIRTKDIGPISGYSKLYLPNSEGAKEFIENAKAISKDNIEIIQMAKSGKDYTKHKDWKDISDRYDRWGVTKDDIINGKLESVNEKWLTASNYIYANEQHSEFTSLYYGKKLYYNINIENYKKLKEVYEDIQLKDDDDDDFNYNEADENLDGKPDDFREGDMYMGGHHEA